MRKDRVIRPLQRLGVLLGGIALSLTIPMTLAENSVNPQACTQSNQFTFSWQFIDDCDLSPRGGTTKGADVVLDPSPHEGWLAIQEAGISDFEKDRRAILAMAGPYRVSFDFIETAGYVIDYTPSRPYQSWSTEYVYVAQDNKDYISLQHIMVMFMRQEDGTLSEPIVMKHWRQDWQYQKRTHLVYAGYQRWNKQKQARKTVKGTWSQAVFQVDDSPRYESFGKWQHAANVSSWVSAKTWRPVPRRESSVRDDYQVLEGTNRHTILPNGWVQEEENMKLVLTDASSSNDTVSYLARELGVARYERIVEHDFSSGDEYWNKSMRYWADVRDVWKTLIDEHDALTIHKKHSQQYMFMPFFNQAQAIVDGEPYNSERGKSGIRELLTPFIELN
jgi:hypothetical protein